jgi:hypothetical protein
MERSSMACTRKLISGPEEFRDARVDRPKKKIMPGLVEIGLKANK